MEFRAHNLLPAPCPRANHWGMMGTRVKLFVLLLCAGAWAVRAANLTFTVGNTSGVTNLPVVVPIRADHFTNISRFQFSCHWSTNVATFVGVEQFGLPGLTLGNFNTGMVASGTIVVSWDEPTGGATNLPAGGVVFGLKLRVVGAVNDTGAVTIDNTPILIGVWDINLLPVPTSVINGTITVGQANTNAPVLVPIGSKSIQEGSALNFVAAASDVDAPVQTLTYSLSNAPAGAVINASSGAFTWTPSEAQGPGVYAVTVLVTDDGLPTLSSQEVLSISVSESNVAPVLASIGAKSVEQGSLLTFAVTAGDADLPAQPLSYSLVGGPAGAGIHPTNGLFTWTPSAMQGSGSYPMVIEVSDGGLIDSELIFVTVTVTPAFIINHPASQTLSEGQNASLTVAATGSALAYQWRKDGTNIPGATSPHFSIISAQLTDAGLYSVTVSNELGMLVSSNASLTVIRFGTPVVRADGVAVVEGVTRNGSANLTLETAFPQGYIFYTLDGSAPSFAAPLYNGAITVSNTVVVRALALSADFSQQAEAPPVTITILPYTVSVTSGGAGLATVLPAQPYYESNSLVTLTATPDSGWSFLRWEGGASGSSNPLQVSVNRSLTVQAVFGTSLVTNMVGNGWIEVTPSGAVPYGSTVELRAVPGPGQKFVAWGSAVSGTNNPRLFNVTQPSPTVAALFAAGPPGLPVITLQPSNRVVSAGGSFTLSVGASGSGPLQYQWRLNGAVLPGATNAALEVSGAAAAQAGAYDVVVTGPDGAVTSQKASVLVTVFDVRPVVSLLGAPGTGYRVDYADDLDAGPWLLLTNGVLSTERHEFIDFTNTNRARRFYRTQTSP